MKIKIITAKKDDPIYQEGITLSHIKSKTIHKFGMRSLDNIQAIKGLKQQSDEGKNDE